MLVVGLVLVAYLVLVACLVLARKDWIVEEAPLMGLQALPTTDQH